MKKEITLKNVFYIPEMYCNLFSLTRAMNDGYAMFGSKENPISIKNENVEISFDRILKSGLGMTMGEKLSLKN